jgi:hypothetical protein
MRMQDAHAGCTRRMQGASWMQDAGCTCMMQDAGCKLRVQDAHHVMQALRPEDAHAGCTCRMHAQDAGCRMQGAGCRVQDAGCRLQYAGCRMQGAGCNVQDAHTDINAATHTLTRINARRAVALVRCKLQRILQA